MISDKRDNTVSLEAAIGFLLPVDEQFSIPSADDSKRAFGGMLNFLTHMYDSENKDAK